MPIIKCSTLKLNSKHMDSNAPSVFPSKKCDSLWKVLNKLNELLSLRLLRKSIINVCHEALTRNEQFQKRQVSLET